MLLPGRAMGFVIVGKRLRHKHAATTERCAHLASDPAHAAAHRTAERTAATMQGGKPELMEMPARRARANRARRVRA